MDLSDAEMVRQCVSAAIVKWDPMDFVPKGKVKSYDPVINELIASLGPKTDKDTLARNIGNTCRKWFGPALFEKQFEDCLPVARKIIKQLS